eukprot:TRINITY_DN6890_c0_g2_i2.p1 TRINITY_DN6890_c0_g2~~TRINITY_DN6890_c0_g2_i2.p1  ORF type:complete len:968 (+),score=225.56 TRINITY_DN6890_c0_g2_i2:542-3445(+)
MIPPFVPPSDKELVQEQSILDELALRAFQRSSIIPQGDAAHNWFYLSPSIETADAGTRYVVRHRYGRKYGCVIRYITRDTLYSDVRDSGPISKAQDALINAMRGKKMPKNVPPKSLNEMELLLHQTVRDALGEIIVCEGRGLDPLEDRIVVRNKLREILLHRGDCDTRPFIEEVTIFSPAMHLRDGAELLDGPGTADMDAIRQARTVTMLGPADCVIVTSEDTAALEPVIVMLQRAGCLHKLLTKDSFSLGFFLTDERRTAVDGFSVVSNTLPDIGLAFIDHLRDALWEAEKLALGDEDIPEDRQMAIESKLASVVQFRVWPAMMQSLLLLGDDGVRREAERQQRTLPTKAWADAVRVFQCNEVLSFVLSKLQPPNVLEIQKERQQLLSMMEARRFTDVPLGFSEADQQTVTRIIKSIRLIADSRRKGEMAKLNIENFNADVTLGIKEGIGKFQAELKLSLRDRLNSRSKRDVSKALWQVLKAWSPAERKEFLTSAAAGKAAPKGQKTRTPMEAALPVALRLELTALIQTEILNVTKTLLVGRYLTALKDQLLKLLDSHKSTDGQRTSLEAPVLKCLSDTIATDACEKLLKGIWVHNNRRALPSKLQRKGWQIVDEAASDAMRSVVETLSKDGVSEETVEGVVETLFDDVLSSLDDGIRDLTAEAGDCAEVIFHIRATGPKRSRNVQVCKTHLTQIADALESAWQAGSAANQSKVAQFVDQLNRTREAVGRTDESDAPVDRSALQLVLALRNNMEFLTGEQRLRLLPSLAAAAEVAAARLTRADLYKRAKAADSTEMVRRLQQQHPTYALTDVLPDGNCGFRATARGLGMKEDDHIKLRAGLCQYMAMLYDSNPALATQFAEYYGETVDSFLHRMQPSGGVGGDNAWMDHIAMEHMVAYQRVAIELHRPGLPAAPIAPPPWIPVHVDTTHVVPLAFVNFDDDDEALGHFMVFLPGATLDPQRMQEPP